MSLLRWLAAPPPDAALEIGPEAIALAVLGGRGGQAVLQGFSVEPLPPGALVPSLTARNVADRTAVAGALRAAIDRLGLRPSRVALVVPDPVAKVSLVRFEHVPEARDDLDQLIRWQVRKAAPFPIDEAQVTYTPGVRHDAGTEFLVAVARRDVVREYETLCEEAGMHAGLVDLATLGVVDLCMAGRPPAGDWLLVYMRPEWTSLVIVRGGHVIFFRTRSEDATESLADAVHQTAMYYQDRLAGGGFARVLLGGPGGGAAAMAAARRSLDERLGVTVEPLDALQAISAGDRGAAPPDRLTPLAPALGLLLRSRVETVGV
jgi:hypothetical protein